MIAEIGQFALILALLVAVFQAVLPQWGAWCRDQVWMASAVPAAYVQFALVLVAFAALMQAFVVSDFSLTIVADNSHAAKPLLYKISGVWGNHEGSLLLWILILTAYQG